MESQIAKEVIGSSIDGHISSGYYIDQYEEYTDEHIHLHRDYDGSMVRPGEITMTIKLKFVRKEKEAKK